MKRDTNPGDLRSAVSARSGDLRRANALRRARSRPRGITMFVTVVCLAVIAALGASLLRSLAAEHRQAQLRRDQMQAFWLAESAVQRGVARLTAKSAYDGEQWQVDVDANGRRLRAQATIRIEPVGGNTQGRRIVVEVRCPAEGAASVMQRREIVVTLDQPGATP